jgi:energy-coupling factor transport system ATP-binding protein
MTAVARVDLRRVVYGDRIALRDVAFDIGRGEIVGVTGPVGAGKTTLALACAGLLGHSVPARIEGGVHHTSLAQPVAGFVFDDPGAQLTGLGGTVEEEVAVGPENLAVPRATIRQRVDRALAWADATHLAQRLPDKLSGGERQRVALACALALDAPLLVLDEPTAQLDPDATQRFVERVRALASAGAGVLLVSQDDEVLATLAARVIVLANGAPVAHSVPDQVRETVSRGARQVASSVSTNALFAAQDLVAGYDGATVLDRLTLELPRGSATAIVGDNGAGKTTLARAIMGLIPLRAGSIHVDGHRIDTLPVHGRARHVGLVFQDPSRQLFARSVVEEVAFGPRALGAGHGAARDRARQALAAVELDEFGDTHPGDLAPQTQRLVAIAAAMASEPAVLILDEPTAGQDAGGKRRIAMAIEQQRARGCAMVITHDLRFAQWACDVAATLSNGRTASRVLSNAGNR